jgi:hypothetical protein
MLFKSSSPDLLFSTEKKIYDVIWVFEVETSKRRTFYYILKRRADGGQTYKKEDMSAEKRT